MYGHPLASPIPAAGLAGAALREAVTEYRAIINAVRCALEKAIVTGAPDAPQWVELDSVYPDKAIVEAKGKYWEYPYALAEDGTVTLGQAVQVVETFVPANAVTAGTGGEEGAMIEAVQAEGQPAGTVWRVWAIRSGLSLNGVDYPEAVLREATPLFEGVRVFEKSDEEHLAGEGKATRNLVGQLRSPRFVEAAGSEAAGIQAELHLLETSGLPAKLVEMDSRGMSGLVGFSIDATGSAVPKSGYREAKAILKVKSLDLIVEPGAGGRIINLIESVGAADMALREKMIAAIQAKHGGSLPAGLNTADDDALETAYREAVATPPAPAAGGDIQALQARLDLADMREAVNACGLPDYVKEKLHAKIERGATPETLREAIADQKDILARASKAGHVTGLGGSVEAGADRSDKLSAMWDDFFDPKKTSISLRECYIETTGDRGVTGLVRNCDPVRLREAAGADFREAISASTFDDVLGNSIARAMVREYAQLEAYGDWTDLVDIVPIRDFRSNERTRVGGYGNLPAVAENAAYGALTSPTDEKATYSISKRGGVETVSLETIANDDVGVIRRIPMKLANAAARTLYEFVLDFLATNPTIYDTTALFTVGHGNLGSTALSAATFAAARLAMKQRTEKDSSKKLGIILRHLYVPAELEETAFELFVRGTNNDETFVQSRKPRVHVVDYWTDANNWFATADKASTPLIELGFYNGNQQPELFTQDLPTQGSLFSNDQIKYKIRHIYGGNVLDFRGFYGAIVA